MRNHYLDSWELYKMHTEFFRDDYKYYLNFCKGYRTLELFAGYGRLTNFLVSNLVDIETVELEKEFAKYINLPNEKNHICDVLEFFTPAKYERIIAAYNSFCLFVEDEQIEAFFKRADDLLEKKGLLSISYYPIDAWRDMPEEQFIYKEKMITYKASYDMSLLDKNIAIWVDEYKGAELDFKYKYPVRIYSDPKDFFRFTDKTSLQLVDIVKDYNNSHMDDQGWLEFIFRKG